MFMLIYVGVHNFSLSTASFLSMRLTSRFLFSICVKHGLSGPLPIETKPRVLPYFPSVCPLCESLCGFHSFFTAVPLILSRPLRISFFRVFTWKNLSHWCARWRNRTNSERLFFCSLYALWYVYIALLHFHNMHRFCYVFLLFSSQRTVRPLPYFLYHLFHSFLSQLPHPFSFHHSSFISSVLPSFLAPSVYTRALFFYPKSSRTPAYTNTRTQTTQRNPCTLCLYRTNPYPVPAFHSFALPPSSSSFFLNASISSFFSLVTPSFFFSSPSFVHNHRFSGNNSHLTDTKELEHVVRERLSIYVQE